MILDLFTSSAVQVAVAGFLVLFVVIKIQKSINNESKIRALGGHAPKIRSVVPLGLDVLVDVVSLAAKNQNLDSWKKWFPSQEKGSNDTVETNLLGKRMIFTADPENIKAVLATQFQDYGKGEGFHKSWEAFLGDSIFTTDGEKWHTSRQLIRPLFIKDRVSDLDALEKHVQILYRTIEKENVIKGNSSGVLSYGRETQIGEHFFRYTLDVATEFMLGHSVQTLGNPKQPFEEAFEEIQRVQSVIARAGSLEKLVPRGTYHSSLKVMDSFLMPFIQATLALDPAELAHKSESGYTFLHALAQFTRDPQVLRDQLSAILIAGRDTTAAAMSWTFFQFARHPGVVKKLRQEILDTCGTDQTPSYENLKNMKYLQNIIKEILRLYPIIPYNVRMSLKDTTLPRGGGSDGLSPIGVLKDTTICYSPLFLQRREQHYPENSNHLEFIPERWETWQPGHWNYIPFNGGPRICIGQQFALTEMGYTIVRLLQRFDRVEDCMSGDGEEKADIVLRPAEGVQVRLWETAKA